MKKKSFNRGYHLIIPAAGCGTRSGLSTPKQFLEIGGKSILQRTLDIFSAHEACQSITIALHPQDIHTYTNQLFAKKPLKIIAGGQSRKESVYNALLSLSNAKDQDLILIHDAARPYLVDKDINTLLDCFAQNPSVQAASLVKAVSDTLIHTDGTRPDRNKIKAFQTPQAFYAGLLRKAHAAADPQAEYTDDTALVTALGESVTLIEAQFFNDKITYPQDVIMAEKLLSAQYETRIGQGFDVHAFEAEPSGKPLILCGVPVAHDKALSGHSDADVGLHTITDALLGAIAAGDIGRHFPPSDPTFKDMDSAIFLEKARDLIGEAGGAIVNIDLTLICEAPKITPHAPAMIERVAQILQINPSRVSIKATTTEKLGFTGRGEGIAAQAVATVKVPIS